MQIDPYILSILKKANEVPAIFKNQLTSNSANQSQDTTQTGTQTSANTNTDN